MAVFTIYQSGSGGAASVAEGYGTKTATDFEVLDGSGDLAEAFVGVNFYYDPSGFFTAGTINAIYGFDGSGGLDYSLTGLNLSVDDYNSTLIAGQSSYGLFQLMLAGNDVLTGSDGNDAFDGSKGSDVIDGGGGEDLLSYNGFAGKVTVDLAAGTATTAKGTSTLTGIEDVVGSVGDDTLLGDGGPNSFKGLGGNDLIDGRGGIDTASYSEAGAAIMVDLTAGTATGGSGKDTLTSIERVIGSRFNDTLLGSAGADVFVGGSGNDTINGRGGRDTVAYIGVTRGVTVDLAAGTATGGGGADKLISIESVTGSVFADTLTGTRGANTLHGDGGNDTLSGGAGTDKLYGDAGNDLLRGGTGTDLLTGGAGKDTFQFDTVLSANSVARITDFSVADDTIALDHTIFTALSGKSGPITSSMFKVITTGGTIDANDHIIYNSSTGALLYDVNGSTSGLADAIQFATLAKGLLLTDADFVLI